MASHVETDDVHLGGHFSTTDPALDADFHVRPGMLWLDISAGEGSAVLRFRNLANNAWIALNTGGGTPANAVLVNGEALTAGGEIVTAG